MLFIYFELDYFKFKKISLIFMRFKVTLKKKGKEFDEVVIANNKNDAIKVALKNNPDSEAINSDWTFKL